MNIDDDRKYPLTSYLGITLVYRSMVRNEITGYHEIHVVWIRN